MFQSKREPRSTLSKIEMEQWPQKNQTAKVCIHLAGYKYNFSN